MKRLVLFACVLSAPLVFAAPPAPAAVTTLKPGAAAPPFDLPGVDGKNHTLAEYADADVLAVLFTCNHCPSAQGAESRVKKLVNDYADASFQKDVVQFNLAFAEKPVTIERIGEEGVKKLAGNDTDKLRLINVWATWCGPCVAEMPSLVEIGRQFETRGFDLITISLDAPEQVETAGTMLKRFHAAMPKLTEASVQEEGRTTNNYLFEGDTDALAEALDNEWQGPIPYTVLIAPGGEILYRKSGEIDADKLRRVIVDRLGRFYTTS